MIPKRGEASADIQRWSVTEETDYGYDASTGEEIAECYMSVFASPDGEWVKYADHEAAVSARERAAVERCCAAVRAVQEKYILKDSAGEYLTDESRTAEECEAAIRAAFPAAPRGDGEGSEERGA